MGKALLAQGATSKCSPDQIYNSATRRCVKKDGKIGKSILAMRKAKSPSPKKSKSPSPKKAKSPSPKKAKSPSPKKAKSPSPKKAKSPSPKKAKSPSPKKAKSIYTDKYINDRLKNFGYSLDDRLYIKDSWHRRNMIRLIERNEKIVELSKTMPEWVTRLNSVLPFWLGYG